MGVNANGYLPDIYYFLMDYNFLVSFIDQLLVKTGDMAFRALETSGGT